MRTLLITIAPFALLACDNGSTDEETGNNAPIADAGPDMTVSADSDIVLDASGSYDPDGDKLTYRWSFNRVPPESALTAEGNFPNNNTSVDQSALRPDVPGTYIVQLRTEDVYGNVSEPDLAVINVQSGSAPVAVTTESQTLTLPGSITLDGTESYDPLGRELTYRWRLSSVPSNSSGNLAESGFDTPTATFTPDVGGRYVASLIVNNGLADSEPAVSYIDVFSADPAPPVADAGPDLLGVFDCTQIPLDGTRSFDPNNDAMTYEWSLQEKPFNSKADATNFEDRNQVITTFYPDVAGNYVVSLAVNDGTSWSTPAILRIEASERNFNSAPVVEAGSDIELEGGSAVCEASGYTFDCESCEAITVPLGLDAVVSDIDNDPMDLEWRITGDAEVEIAEPTSLNTSATLYGASPTDPLDCAETKYRFELSATDCPTDETVDTMQVIVTCCGAAPTEDSGT
ncbi:MAG: PKD domain-containing protein [Myxococcota bacterium]